MKQKTAIVITSINSANALGVMKLKAFLEDFNQIAIIVADLKTPKWEKHDNIIFLSVEDQNALWPKLSKLLPFNHYSRKNLGYLYAISLGVERILDTDDDNVPVGNPWTVNYKEFRETNCGDWFNVYRLFGENQLWPRGLPLSFANHRHDVTVASPPDEITCFQSLVDGDPDIDAIGRMLFPNKVLFEENHPIRLRAAICPTNSQATIWTKWVLPLLYLPTTATFRMTDIWRGLIAQPIIHLLGGETIFGKLGFVQERNKHNLLKDFESEAIGHLYNELVYEVSKSVWESSQFTRDSNSIMTGMQIIYEKLIKLKIINQSELKCFGAWREEVESLEKNSA